MLYFDFQQVYTLENQLTEACMYVELTPLIKGNK